MYDNTELQLSALTNSYIEAFDEWSSSPDGQLWDPRPSRSHKGIPPQLDRITQDPGVMGGATCIRGMRVTVSMVVSQIGAGRSSDEILADYPYLESEDIAQALRYAAWLVDYRDAELAAE